jgi:hypothetical protein
MKITYLHASKFGHGALAAEEFKQHLAPRGVSVEVHHIREVDARHLPAANLYLFSSPGRMAGPLEDGHKVAEFADHLPVTSG